MWLEGNQCIVFCQFFYLFNYLKLNYGFKSYVVGDEDNAVIEHQKTILIMDM
jgi:hypothetical protein